MFGDWLKLRRLEAGLSQEALARAAEGACTGAYISSLERKADIGKRGQPTTPSREIVIALARALGVSENEALHQAGYSANEDRQANRFAALEAQIEQLSPHDQEEIEVVLQMIERDIAARRRSKQSLQAPQPDAIVEKVLSRKT